MKQTNNNVIAREELLKRRVLKRYAEAIEDAKKKGKSIVSAGLLLEAETELLRQEKRNQKK